MLAECQFSSGKTSERPSRPMISLVFLGPRANVEFVSRLKGELAESLTWMAE